MTLLSIALGIAAVGFGALWLDERLTRKTVQSSYEFWRDRALGLEKQETEDRR